jgi:hypothetical protein
MKILFVADGRSPIFKNWIRHFSGRGDEAFLASTFACDVDFPLKRLRSRLHNPAADHPAPSACVPLSGSGSDP